MDSTPSRPDKTRLIISLRVILILAVVLALGVVAARSLLFVSCEQACINTELASLRTPISGHVLMRTSVRSGTFLGAGSGVFSVENERVGNLEVTAQYNYLQNSIDALENDISQDVISRQRHEADYRRMANLLADGAVSRREYEEVENSLKLLSSSIEQKGTQLLHLRERFAETQRHRLLQTEAAVSMARDGVIWAVFGKDGEFMNAGEEVAQAVYLDHVWVEAFFSERYARLLRPGVTVQVRELGSSRRWQGRVESVRAGVGRVVYDAPVAVPPQKLKERLVCARISVAWDGAFGPDEFYGVGRSVEVRVDR